MVIVLLTLNLQVYDAGNVINIVKLQSPLLLVKNIIKKKQVKYNICKLMKAFKV